MKKLGFIGCGNMGKAMLGGVVKSGLLAPEEVMAADLYAAGLEAVAAEFGIETTTDNRKVAAECETIVLAVKPHLYPAVIAGIADCVTENTLIITIAPGKTLAAVTDMFQKPVKLVRTMPNTPALVGEGMTGVCCNELVEEADLEKALAILRSFGRAELVDESLMDAVVAVSGSSPAYVYMLIEAMADAAVLGGMARPLAYEFAAQAVLGSAKMVLETHRHPGDLKDMVCSPRGTTIEAVRVLEERGLRAAVIDAMVACMDKSKGM